MVKAKIIKQCQQSCHLFHFFFLNNKVIFCDAFTVENMKKSLFSNKFFSFIFGIKMIVNTVEKDQIKYFAQN